MKFEKAMIPIKRPRTLIAVLVAGFILAAGLGFGLGTLVQTRRLARPVTAAPLSKIASLEQQAFAGSDVAQTCLASAYQFGEGVPQNNSLAYAWQSIAIATRDGGKEDFKLALDLTQLNRKGRSSETIAEGERLAAELWKKVRH